MPKNVHALIDDLHKGLDELRDHFSQVESIFSSFARKQPGRRRARKASAGRPRSTKPPGERRRRFLPR